MHHVGYCLRSSNKYLSIIQRTKMYSTSGPSSHKARTAPSRYYPRVKQNIICKLKMSALKKYEILSMLWVGSYLPSFLLVLRFTVLHFTSAPFLIIYRLFYFFSPHSPLVYVHFFYLHSFFTLLYRLSGVVNRQSALPPSLSASFPLYVASHPNSSSSARRYNVILLQSVSRYSSHPIR